MSKLTVRRCLRYSALALFVFFGICLAWYLVSRITAPLRAVRVYDAKTSKTHEATPRQTLCVVTYNIAHGRGARTTSNWQRSRMAEHRARLDKIADLLKQQDADVVVLNEVDLCAFWTRHINQAEHVARRAGYPYWIEQANFDAAMPFMSMRWGNAVLSRHPVEEARLVDLPGLSAWEAAVLGKKRALLCVILLPDGRRVRLLAVHLEPRSEPVRIAGARKIEEVRRESALPLIVAGDMNSTPVGFPGATPNAAGQTAMSLLLESGAYRTSPEQHPVPGDLTFPSTAPQRIIDWILVPADWAVTSRTVPSAPLSDHLPVVMDTKPEDKP